MPAYSFKFQFVAKIESGEKTHTIRGKRKSRPIAGQRFVGYYGMRTKQCRKLIESVITRVQEIRIERSTLQPHGWDGLYPKITIDGEVLAFDEANALAQRDGFDDLRQMVRFWDLTTPVDRDLIHWKFPGVSE